MKYATCLICGGKTYPLVDDEINVTYDKCINCNFIYKQKIYHPDYQTERERYLKHHNSEKNIEYITYMNSFINEAIIPLNIKGKILDFGSGPVPILKQLLIDKGYEVYDFDPFFNNDLSYQKHTYDLIILTEVLEHIVKPYQTLEELLTYLNKDGILLIQTQLHSNKDEKFLKWWYRRDITHIGFFNTKTMEYLSSALSLKIIKNNKIDQITFQKVN